MCIRDSVTLADNTQIAGKLTHYFDGIVVIETSGGQKLELPRDKIKSITFKLPPPRAEFSTPEKTFERWRGAMVKGEVQKAIDCYALLYQGQVGQQMMQSADELDVYKRQIGHLFPDLISGFSHKELYRKIIAELRKDGL